MTRHLDVNEDHVECLASRGLQSLRTVRNQNYRVPLTLQ